MNPLMEQIQALKHLRALLTDAAPLSPEAIAAIDNIETMIARQAGTLRLLKAAFSDLALDVKYLQFDLDCTRQERDEALGII